MPRTVHSLDVAHVLVPVSAHADSFGHGREIRIMEFRAGAEEACRLLLYLDKTNVPLLITTTFTGRRNCTRLRKSPISMTNSPSPDGEMTRRQGNAACAPIVCAIA